jgi:hypothetical protein
VSSRSTSSLSMRDIRRSAADESWEIVLGADGT